MTEALPSIPKQPRCAGARRDGAACSATPLPDRAWCFAHDPDRAEERAAARRKGGLHRASAVRLKNLMPPRLAPIYDILEAALDQVANGTLAPQQATAMATLARALVAVLTAGELEERVRRLEQGSQP